MDIASEPTDLLAEAAEFHLPRAIVEVVTWSGGPSPTIFFKEAFGIGP